MRYEQRLIWVLGITFGFLFFDRNAASFLMPFIARDLSFSNQQVGLIASALSFTWAVSAFLGGALSDHTGRRKAVLLASAIAFSLCSVISGLAGSFLALFAARFLMGLVEGPFMPVCQSLLASESEDSRRGHNMGVMQNFGSNLLGSFVAPLVLVPLAAHWNWRAAFFLAGVPGLVMAVLIARYVHEPQKKSQPAAGGAGGAPPMSAPPHEPLRHARPSQHDPVCAHEHLHGRLDGARVGLPAALLRQGAPVIVGGGEGAHEPAGALGGGRQP